MEKKSYTNTNINNSQPNKIRGGETNIMKNVKKVVSVLSTTALAASLVVPFAGVASAATDSRVGDVQKFTKNAEGAELAKLTFKEDSEYTSDLKAGTITLTFPKGAKVDSVNVVLNDNTVTGDTYVNQYGDYTVSIKLPAGYLNDDDTPDKLEITPTVNFDEYDMSSVDVKVESFDAGIPNGTYTLATVAQGKTTTTVLSTKTQGESDNAEIGTFRIEESAVGSLDGKVYVKLPKGFEWTNSTNVNGLAGLSNDDLTVSGQGGRTLQIDVAEHSARGYIQVQAFVKMTKDAKFGDIELEVYGDKASDENIVLGEYSDYAVTVEADGDPEELISGTSDQDLQTLKIKQNVANSLFSNRKTTVTLPKEVKIKDVTSDLAGFSFAVTDDTYDNEFTFTTPGTLPTSFTFDITVDVDADFTGDIVAQLDGRAGIEGEVVLATTQAPISISAESKNVKLGLKNQAVGNIVLTEAEEGVLEANEEIRLYLDENVKWNGTPKVEVTKGDLEIKSDDVEVKEDDNDVKYLSIVVKEDSSKASEITISNAKIDVDRTVPEGDIKVNVKGNFIDNSSVTDVDSMGKFQIANVVTGSYTDASFVIGSTTYTVNGEEKAMDVAPFIQDGRTLLPVRYVAEAFGLNDDNIIWNQAAKTVTIMKGDRVAQLTIGSNVLTVNGVQVPMDVKAQVVDGRTVLPVRYVAQALGAQIDYNDVTKTITVK